MTESAVPGFAASSSTAVAELQALLAALPDVIIVLSRDGRYEKIAETGTANLYKPPADLLGRRLHDVFPQPRADEFLDVIARALATGQPVQTEYVLEIGGRRVDFECTVAPMLGDRVVWVARDITPRRAAEAEVRARNAAAQQSRQFEALGRLAAGVAHDFNNILTAIRTNTELALAHDAGAREELTEILQATGQGAELVRQLFTLGRAAPTRDESVVVDDVVREHESILRRLLGSAATLAVTAAAPGRMVRIDRAQLGQVLLNLVVNARDALGGRVGVISLETQPAPGGGVTLVVADDGMGMDDVTRARIFEPFFTTKGGTRGTGLGLATVYAIVEHAGGRVDVDSAVGRGSTFRVTFPEAGAPASAAPASGGRERPRRITPPGQAAIARGARPPAGSVGTILLVEDENPVRNAVHRMLAALGYTVIEARHGRDALLKLEQRGAPVDLVVSDVVMPEMNGIELANELRRRDPTTRLLLMSGYAQDVLEKEGGVMPDAPFLEKPFTFDGLAAAVKAAVQPREG